MKFPTYRKMNGFDRWYKIVSETEFYECVKMGEKFILNHIVAKQYPERLRIMDMLSCTDPFISINDIEHFFQA